MGFTQTTIYNDPIITFPNTTFAFGAAVFNPLTIPLVLESYLPPQGKVNVNIITTMPIITGNGLAVGGSYVSHGSTELPKIQMEGFMDTPMETAAVAGHQRPTLQFGGIRYTYADVIAAYVEGRVGNWTRIDPSSFRDPYGRVWTNPRILDFSASYVEMVPGRTRFTMQLLVTS